MNFIIHKKLLNNIVYTDTEYPEIKKKLNKIKIKLLVVIKKNYQVIGTISDGDIRRKAISKKSFNITAKDLMNNNPFLLNKNKKVLKKNILKFKYGIKVDDKKKFLDIIDLNLALYNHQTAAVIMAGGFGERLLPLTKTLPKPLIEINKKTVISKIIEDLNKAQIQNIYVTLHYMNKKILDEIEKIRVSPFLNIKHIYEKKPLGTAGSLSYLKNSNFQNFIVCNSDIVSDFDFKKMLKSHQKKRSDFTILTKKYEYQIPYGVVNIKKNRVTNIIEKPLINFNTAIGFYIINKNIILKMKNKKKLDMPELINFSLKNGFKVDFFETKKKIIDIGSKEELIKLNSKYQNYFI